MKITEIEWKDGKKYKAGETVYFVDNEEITLINEETGCSIDEERFVREIAILEFEKSEGESEK